MKLNEVFHTENGIVLFVATSKNEADFAGKNYLINRNNKVVAVIDDEEVEAPEVLFNEVGVAYTVVNDLYAFATKRAKKNGVYKAVKQEPIRIWRNIKPGDVLKTVVDGFQEHVIELTEDQLAAQNIIKGEFYGISKAVLEERYTFARHEADYDVYEPREDKPTDWVYCDMNICCPLWGGIEFITTPMINITNPSDCYACNFIVWWGNDGRLASYKVLQFIRGCGTVFFERQQDVIIPMAKAPFNPPKELIA